MKNVTVETKLTINLTAEQWQLYSRKKGAMGVAIGLNTGVQDAINTASDATAAGHQAMAVMRKYQDFGSYDTEPLAVMAALIQLRFPNWSWR